MNYDGMGDDSRDLTRTQLVLYIDAQDGQDLIDCCGHPGWQYVVVIGNP